MSQDYNPVLNAFLSFGASRNMSPMTWNSGHLSLWLKWMDEPVHVLLLENRQIYELFWHHQNGDQLYYNARKLALHELNQVVVNYNMYTDYNLKSPLKFLQTRNGYLQL